MDVRFPARATRALLLALLVALSLESEQPEGCPPHMEVPGGTGTQEEGHTRARVRNRDGGHVGVPVQSCASACNAKTENIKTHIIAQIRARADGEEVQNQATTETITVNLVDTCCRVMPTPGGGIKPRNVSILLVLFVWSRKPVEYRLVYKESCGITIRGVYLVQPGIPTPGGTLETVVSTVTLPDHNKGRSNVFNMTFNANLISGRTILTVPLSHRIFIKELLPQILTDVEEQFPLVSETMSTGSVSFADFATDWFLDVGQGCCGSAELEQKSNDSIHVSPRIPSFPTLSPAGGANANDVFGTEKPVVLVVLFVSSAVVYVVAVLCQRTAAARFKPNKINSTVQPVNDVIIEAHMKELQPAVMLPSYEEALRNPLKPIKILNLGPPPTYDEESAGVVTYI